MLKIETKNEVAVARIENFARRLQTKSLICFVVDVTCVFLLLVLGRSSVKLGTPKDCDSFVLMDYVPQAKRHMYVFSKAKRFLSLDSEPCLYT